MNKENTIDSTLNSASTTLISGGTTIFLTLKEHWWAGGIAIILGVGLQFVKYALRKHK